MAHTDACKYQVTQLVEKLTEKGLGITKACEETEIESDGIPASTIKRWYYEIQKESSKMNSDEKPTVTPQPDSETQTDSSLETPPEPPGEPSVDEPTHGGKREGAGAPATTTPRKKSYDRFWVSISNQINKLCERISDGGGFPIKENAKQETMNELIDALNLLNQYLKEVR